MPFELIRQDITKMQVDVIVNAANEQLQQGGGVCGAIFRAAGATKLQQACDEIGFCATGQTVVTQSFDLEATYLFHTVGPVWQGGDQQEARLLKSCYNTALQLAVEKNCSSIAFPLISSGIYGYPKNEAFQLASETILHFLEEHELHVYLVLFDQQALLLPKQLRQQITEYIDEHYVEDYFLQASEQLRHSSLEQAIPRAESQQLIGLEEILARLDDTFQQRLFRLIDARGHQEVDIYKRANLSRKHFSKIRANVHYQPKKTTVLALAIALQLSLDETLDFLRCAGYTLSNSTRFDVIVRHFIERGVYSIYTINEALFELNEPILI